MSGYEGAGESKLGIRKRPREEVDPELEAFHTFFLENREKLTPQVETWTKYAVNTERLKQWEERSTNKECATDFATKFRVLTFTQFREALTQIAAELIQVHNSNKFARIVLIVGNSMSKSNFWMPLLLYSVLAEQLPSQEPGLGVFNGIAIVGGDYLVGLEGSGLHADESTLYVFADDASYSGDQLATFLRGVFGPPSLGSKVVIPRPAVYLSIPVMSELAYEMLAHVYKEAVETGKIIIPSAVIRVPMLLPQCGNLGQSRVPLVLNTRLADHTSTPLGIIHLGYVPNPPGFVGSLVLGCADVPEELELARTSILHRPPAPRQFNWFRNSWLYKLEGETCPRPFHKTIVYTVYGKGQFRDSDFSDIVHKIQKIKMRRAREGGAR